MNGTVDRKVVFQSLEGTSADHALVRAPRPSGWLHPCMTPEGARAFWRLGTAEPMKRELAAVGVETAVRLLSDLAADLRAVGIDVAVDRYLDRLEPFVHGETGAGS